MEAQPAPFFDFLDLDSLDPYHSPDQDVDDDTICLNQFPPYTSEQDPGGPQTPADMQDLIPRANVWAGFHKQDEAMEMAGQKQFFVDPELYTPDSDGDVQGQIQVVAMRMSQPSTRRSSTKPLSRGSTDITPPEQGPFRKRKTRKIKKESGTGEEDQKRNKFLERNRIAASKCREKKKQFVSELEETKIDLEARHNHLQVEAASLMNEVGLLKHNLMLHAKCNDANIDRWINNEARKFVQTNNEMYGPPFLHYGQAPPPELLANSPRSRNLSNASSYPSLQNMQYDGLGPTERKGSIAYSHGEPTTHHPRRSRPHCQNVT